MHGGIVTVRIAPLVTLTRWTLSFSQKRERVGVTKGDSVPWDTARHVWLRLCRAVSIVIVIAVVTSVPIGAESAPAHPRLRLPDRRLLPVVQAGRDASPSFRALIERLETTDVVVFVQCARLRSRLDGELTFLAAAGGLRYVLVRIGWDLPLERKIAVLGHELQHALEVARNSDTSAPGRWRWRTNALDLRGTGDSTGWISIRRPPSTQA
jgi:hypothetical protein